MGLASVAGAGSNQFPKYVVMCIGLPAVSGLFFAGRARWPAPFGYFFSVVLFTAPIIALSGGPRPSPQPSSPALHACLGSAAEQGLMQPVPSIHCIAGYQLGSVQWDLAWYRLLMVLIGVGLPAVVQPLLFPRTSVGSAQHRMQVRLRLLRRRRRRRRLPGGGGGWGWDGPEAERVICFWGRGAAWGWEVARG